MVVDVIVCGWVFVGWELVVLILCLQMLLQIGFWLIVIDGEECVCDGMGEDLVLFGGGIGEMVCGDWIDWDMVVQFGGSCVDFYQCGDGNSDGY